MSRVALSAHTKAGLCGSACSMLHLRVVMNDYIITEAAVSNCILVYYGSYYIYNYSSCC